MLTWTVTTQNFTLFSYWRHLTTRNRAVLVVLFTVSDVLNTELRV